MFFRGYETIMNLLGSYHFYRLRVTKTLGLYKHYRACFDRNKCVFIHIPKCGGISLVEAVYGDSRSQHSTWRDFLIEDPIKFDSYFKFAFTRDPVNRCYSAYTYLKRGGRTPLDLYWNDRYIKKYSSFDDFVLRGLEGAIANSAEHFIPQHKFICDDAGKVLVDFVGRVERMQEDYQYLADKLGITAKLELRNATEEESAYVASTKVRSTIRRLYHKDYEILGYAH
jgi:chondroitin 4-sulfotransferase 11